MKYHLLLMLFCFFSINFAQTPGDLDAGQINTNLVIQDTKDMVSADTQNTTNTLLPPTLNVPTPPVINSLPDLELIQPEDVSYMYTSVTEEKYAGTNENLVPAVAVGIWARVYSEETSIFNIPVIGEEKLNIQKNSQAVWVQEVTSSQTIRSLSKRQLIISYFDLFGTMFFVFHYPNQDPFDQKVRDKQGYFVRILTSKGYMQMSRSPKFNLDESLYWKKINPPKPPAQTNQTQTQPQTQTQSTNTPQNTDTGMF